MNPRDQNEEILFRKARGADLNRREMRELGGLLPADAGALDELLARTVDHQEPELFTNLLVAAMATGRRPDARHLIEGAALLLTMSPLGLAVHYLSGDVGGALVAAVRSGQMGSEREGTALVAAAAWGQRQSPPVIPAELIYHARRLARRDRDSPLNQQSLMAVATLTDDAGLRKVLTDINGFLPPEAGRNFLEALVSAPEHEPLCFCKETTQHTLAAGFTMRRAAERVGRNDGCPCGSGAKYKKCCMGKDQERLAQPSEVAGVTRDELRSHPERYLTLGRIEEMRSHDLARLDPQKVPLPLAGRVIERLAAFELHDLAIGFLEKVGCLPQLRGAWEFLFMSARQAWQAPLLVRLRAVAPADLWLAWADIQTDLILETDRGRQLERLNEAALQALKASRTGHLPKELIGIAYALLEGPFAPLGIVLTRGVLPYVPPLDAFTLLDTLLQARDRLELDPNDPAEEQLEANFLAQRQPTLAPDKSLDDALERLEEKSEEIRHLKERLDRVQSDLQQRERFAKSAPASTLPATPSSKPSHSVPGSPVTDPLPGDEAAVRELRRKVEELRSGLTERHAERNRLRRELQEAQVELETLRSKRGQDPNSAEAGATEVEDGWHGDESFTAQPVRVVDFPRKFPEVLRGLPRSVARSALVLIGRLAAGELAAFRGAKRLRRDRELWRQRLGDYRLLFRLHAERLEVMELVPRRDLERCLKGVT